MFSFSKIKCKTHSSTINHICEEQLDLEHNKINIFSSNAVKDRRYDAIVLPYDQDSVVEGMFLSLYRDKNIFDPAKIYYTEHNSELPILELVSFIFSETDKFKACQNLVTYPDKDDIQVIIDQNHSGKFNLHRRINETTGRTKSKFNWHRMDKDIKNF